MAPFKVIVVGSGLAGNLLANGLINNNIEVEVYERLAKHAKREGYQIRLGENALKGFRACLTPQRKELIVSKFGRNSGKFASAPILYDDHFRPVLDLNRFPNWEKSAAISRKILRDLLAEPVDEAGKLFYDKSFTHYEVINPGTQDEKIRVYFEDDTSSDCDILVAADGAHSKVNEQVGLNNLVPIDSHWSFLSKSELPTKSYLEMDKALWAAPVGISSTQRQMYYCAYLPDKVLSETETATAAAGKDSPPKFDDSISSCFFAYGIPVGQVPQEIKDWPTEQQWDYIAKDMQAHWSPKYQEIVQLLKGSDLYVFQGRASTKPPANWRQKIKSASVPEKGHPRVIVLGDAMHAMLPTRGMGGNQAMRDTSVLLPLLVKMNETAKLGKLSNGHIEDSCQEFEAEMIPRAFGWVAKSGGTSVLALDTATWTGWLVVLSFGWVLNIAYHMQRLANPFRKQVYTDEAPEFQR